MNRVVRPLQSEEVPFHVPSDSKCAVGQNHSEPVRISSDAIESWCFQPFYLLRFTNDVKVALIGPAVRPVLIGPQMGMFYKCNNKFIWPNK